MTEKDFVIQCTNIVIWKKIYKSFLTNLFLSSIKQTIQHKQSKEHGPLALYPLKHL